ncbi:uncharacterized protein LOC125758869 [Rhipicephalus sanguineus]|uniref:uncharacterized protein LOC125758869 n=1 Tax=Rhipicephalus sanguineus TaxID=34632 RepID=UPI0020C3E8C1|nr:uncharacterized protein LOC125758869 [Rhipicephalus sanguineus]
MNAVYQPVKNGASTTAISIPVITPSPPEDELYFSCTSISSGSPVEGASGDERPSPGTDAEKEPANGASTVVSNGDTLSHSETASGRDLLSVGRPVTPLRSPPPAVGSPSNGSDTSWSMLWAAEPTGTSSPGSAASLALSRQSRSSSESYAGRMEDDETRNIHFLLKRRAQRLKEVRRFVKRYYAKNKALLLSPPSL